MLTGACEAEAVEKPHLRHSEALWIQEHLLYQCAHVRGRIGAETPGGIFRCLGGRRRSKDGEEGRNGGKQELADVGMSSPKSR